MHPPIPPRIAVVNSNNAILETISTMLEQEGYVAIPALADTFRLKGERLNEFLAEQAPQVVLWDIAPPYETNWQYFQQVKSLPLMQKRPCVLTTTNARRLKEMVGTEEDGIEIVGKPYDLEQVLSAIKKALAARR